jgi:hypothetical protein
MYTFERNTKVLCIVLMLIGVIALLYGFISADKNTYSDKDIKKIVKELYKQNSSEQGGEGKYKHKEMHHVNDKKHNKEDSSDYHYASLFQKIEKRFNCHLDYDQKKNAHSLDDVIYVTKHYFHTIKQRPWSSLFVNDILSRTCMVSCSIYFTIWLVSFTT